MIEEILRPILIALIVILSLYILKNIFFPPKFRPPIPTEPAKPNKRVMMNKEELSVFNGTKDVKIYISIKDQIFDVSPGKSFYGPGCSYNTLTGKDSTVALGKMDLAGNFDGLKYDSLDVDEKETVDGWEQKFLSKYNLIGMLYHNQEDKKKKEEEEEIRYSKELDGWKVKLEQHQKRVEEIKQKYYN